MIDVFDVGVHIGMTSNGGHVIGELMRALGALDRTASMVSRNFDKMKLAAVGALGIFAGAKSLEGLYHMVEAAKDLNHELEKIKLDQRIRIDDTALERVRLNAWDMVQQVPGTKVEDNVRVQRELAATFKDMGEVHEVLRSVLVANQALSWFGDTKTDVAQVAVRALEMRGHIAKNGRMDPIEFQKELDALTKSVNASNGMLKPEDFLQAIRQAGPAAMAMSADAFWGMMPAAMVGMGSAKAGTALMSLYQQVIGHKLQGRSVAEAMESVGMVRHGGWHMESGHVVMASDAVVNQAQFASDPFTYMHNLLEHIKTMKDKNGKSVDEVGLFQHIFQISSRATSARMISDIAMNWPAFQNEIQRYNNAASGEATNEERNKNDLSAAMNNFSAAWHNLNAALGSNGVDATIVVLHDLTDALNGITKWAIADPRAAHNVFEVAAGLSALSIALGAFAIGRSIFSPVTSGIRLLAGAATAANAAGVAGGLTGTANGLSGLASVRGLAGLGGVLMGAAAGLSAIAAIQWAVPQAVHGAFDWLFGRADPGP